MIKIDIKNQRNKYLGMEGVLCYSINTFVWLKFVELLYLIVIFEKKRELTFIIKEPTKNSLQCANAIHKKNCGCQPAGALIVHGTLMVVLRSNQFIIP
jgi:hypothetical protein